MNMEKTLPVCYSLSRSSSAQPCSSLGGLETKPEIHKSLNSIHCVPKCEEDNIQQSHHSILPPTQDTAADKCPVKTDFNHLSVEEKTPQKNHYRSADSSLANTEPEITQNFVRYDVSENISLLGRSETSLYEAESLESLNMPSMMVQKSYSDYCCGQRNSVPRSVKVQNKTSATYLNLSSSGSISASGSERICNLSNVTQDSGIVHSLSNIQNILTDATSPDRDYNIPLCHLDSSSIQHNIVYAIPGTCEHGILGPRNSGNGFPNTGHVFGQSHNYITGFMSSNNITETKLHPQTMVIHNNFSVHSGLSHEPTIKNDDTIAAYCHSMPIPSAQISAGLGHSVGDPGSTNGQPQLCSHSKLSDTLIFPKLVSSVSESGLDARKLIGCGQLTLPQALVSVEELHVIPPIIGNNELLLKTLDNSPNNFETNSGRKMKDSWTMTSINYFSETTLPISYKDAEVQTMIMMETKSVSTIPCLHTTGHSHLHPEVALGFTLQCPQSPIREVRWDDEGMTWEVYGAAVDPEVLGLAIQKHLEIQIEQHTQPSEVSGEMEVEDPGKEKRRSFRSVIRSLRQSNCCVGTNSASE